MSSWYLYFEPEAVDAGYVYEYSFESQDTHIGHLIKQYQHSPIIKKLVENHFFYFNNFIFDDFYKIVWNINTAQGFGLDIWGRIVGVNRLLKVTELFDKFGFNNSQLNTFNNGVFFSGEPESNNFELTDNAYRVLILAKALSNISACDCQSINAVLQNLFPNRGRAYVNDLGDMRMRYTFEFFLEPWEKSVLLSAGALPRPSGVQIHIAQIPTPNTFGFNGQGLAPWNSGTFLNTGAIDNATN